jgi:hypothetical protein
VTQNKTILQNDPHRDLLIIPADDVGVSEHSDSSLLSVSLFMEHMSGNQSLESVGANNMREADRRSPRLL